jgi:murein L,D-transpeptidase YcbB/YkuD
MRRIALTAAAVLVTASGITGITLTSVTSASAAVSCTGTSLVQGVGTSDQVRVPTVGNGSGNWHCQLGLGNDSVAVSRLQIALDSWCNLSAGLTVDGDYGPLTQQAVRNVQHAYGITVDGIYGPQTAYTILWPIAGSNGNACTLIG